MKLLLQQLRVISDQCVMASQSWGLRTPSPPLLTGYHQEQQQLQAAAHSVL